VPAVARLFGRDDVAKVAGVVADAAQAMTGQSDQDGIVAAIEADPALALKLANIAAEAELGLERERSRQLEIVNTTMQTEAKSNDVYVRRMRPTFGYVMAATWAVQMGATSWAVIDSPRDAPAVLAALAETWWLWTVALSVLGIYVAGRSKEKGSSLLGALPFPVPGRKPGR
jgi:hypothetical protein